MKPDKFKSIKRVLWWILLANISVAAVKILLGIIMNSASVMADGFHSLTDGSSNIIGLIGIGMASKPVDEDHPYGHRKYETLTGLFIVGMLVFLGFRIIIEAVNRFMKPSLPEISVFGLIVMLMTLIINIFISRYERKKGKLLNSTILISDAMHTQSDVYVTISVIVSLLAIKSGAPSFIDPITSLIVAMFILKAAFNIFKVASGILVDSHVVEIARLENIVMSHKGVKGVHKIRSRGTPEDMQIDMHILAEPQLSLEHAHLLTHELQDLIRSELQTNAEVIIHLEPFGSDPLGPEK